MKNLAQLFTACLLLATWSCGGGSESKKEAAVDTSKKVEKSYDLSTKEGMLMKMKDFKIDIPSEMTLVEVNRKDGSYVAKFEALEMDENLAEKLQNWFSKETQELSNEGWQPRLIRDNDKMLGSFYNQTLFYRAKKNSSLSDAIDLSSVYDKEKQSFTVYISFDEV